jgi:hypothetical protein
MRICIRIRVMRLMSDSAYAYAYVSLYIYGPYALERGINQVILASKVTDCVVYMHVDALTYSVRDCSLQMHSFSHEYVHGSQDEHSSTIFVPNRLNF